MKLTAAGSNCTECAFNFKAAGETPLPTMRSNASPTITKELRRPTLLPFDPPPILAGASPILMVDL
jgi:hypothetical protein